MYLSQVLNFSYEKPNRNLNPKSGFKPMLRLIKLKFGYKVLHLNIPGPNAEFYVYGIWSGCRKQLTNSLLNWGGGDKPKSGDAIYLFI